MDVVNNIMMKLVEVEWIDSNSRSGWQPLNSQAGFAQEVSLICRSVGYVIYEDKERLSLAQSLAWYFDNDPDSASDLVTIPKVAVVQVKELRGMKKYASGK